MSKRLVDILLSLLGLVLLLPIFIVVSLAIWIFDGMPILFLQERIGVKGRRFNLYKFRSMSLSQGGPLITVAGDRRITRVGSVLRKTKLDELPQLVNVFLGQMSFVGPRPEVEKYTALYDSEQSKVLELLPGITDPASLIFFNESDVLQAQSDPEGYYVKVLMPEKIRINLQYAKRANTLRDIWIMILTVFRVAGIKMPLPNTKIHDQV